MLKKIYFLAVATVATTAFGMSDYAAQFTSSNIQSQLDHVKTQMQSIKRAWNSAKIRIKLAEKASPALAQNIKATLDKILTSDAFTTKMNDTIASNVDSIVNNNMSFDSVKTEFNLSDFFPSATMHDFGKKLFSAMANRTYCLELGKKLAQKMQELQIAVDASRTTTSQF